ncbi:MAG: hypothetical protein GW928_08900 [Rhodoferax sp.]|nr:hypothetical protein [Rhodoferax sp.]
MSVSRNEVKAREALEAAGYRIDSGFNGHTIDGQTFPNLGKAADQLLGQVKPKKNTDPRD